jgi:hypothetical protein
MTYKTVAATIGDITVTISKKTTAGDRLIAFLEWLGPKVDNELPGSGGRPDQGLPPSPGHPDQGLPGGGTRPDQGLPPSGGSGGHPDQGLPGGGARPDNDLPPNFLGDHAKEIAKAILKGTACDIDKPK